MPEYGMPVGMPGEEAGDYDEYYGDMMPGDSGGEY
jgi:hypothetical protein